MEPVAYAGEPGAFAEDAVIAAFGDVERVPVGGFRAVFETVVAGPVAAGVVPIENVINGTVRENYDLLLEHDLEIRAEVVDWQDLVAAGSMAEARKRALVRSEGKAYPVRDGDVIEVLFNVGR